MEQNYINRTMEEVIKEAAQYFSVISATKTITITKIENKTLWL